jgi:hypothetical protein
LRRHFHVLLPPAWEPPTFSLMCFSSPGRGGGGLGGEAFNVPDQRQPLPWLATDLTACIHDVSRMPVAYGGFSDVFTGRRGLNGGLPSCKVRVSASSTTNSVFISCSRYLGRNQDHTGLHRHWSERPAESYKGQPLIGKDYKRMLVILNFHCSD